MRRRTLAIGAGVVAATAVVAVGALLWPRGTTEITEQDAVDEFRSTDGTASTEPEANEATDGGLPTPGVYTFTAEGEQSVKLGPLPTETRPLPDTITAVVADAPDDCFDWTVNFFAEHVEDTRFCVDGDQLRLDEHVKHQQIGALSPIATMTCDPDVIIDSAGDGVELRCQLDLDGGPATIAATLEGTTTVGRPTSLTVGDEDVDVTPVTISYEVSGDLTGSWDETTWWSDDRLPVQVERSVDLRGPATFTEDSRLALTALAPTT